MWAQESLQCIKTRWIYGQYDEKSKCELTEEIKNDNLIIDLALNLKGTEKQATDKY